MSDAEHVVVLKAADGYVRGCTKHDSLPILRRKAWLVSTQRAHSLLSTAFQVSRAAACVSKTIERMLDGASSQVCSDVLKLCRSRKPLYRGTQQRNFVPRGQFLS